MPFSEAKVFRTDRGFIIKDNDDQEWCKYIPFDDLDRIKTDIACRTLEPEQITAMKTMPIPSFSKHPKDLLDEIQASFEKLCTKTQQPGEQEEEEQPRPSLLQGEQPDNSFHSKDKPYSGPADAIQRWVEEGQRLLPKKTIKILSIRPAEDPTDSQSNMTLSKQDVIRHTFGTLTPFIQDYTRDIYEVEEDHTLHLPSIPTFNRFGPLSYQRSILQEDPILHEDLEENKLNNIPIGFPETEKEAPSLLDSYLQQQQPTQKHKTIATASQQQQNHTQTEDTDGADAFESLCEMELDIWDVFQKSMPPRFLLKSILSVLLLFIMGIGLAIHANIAIILSIFFAFIQFSTAAFHDAQTTFNNFMDRFSTAKTRRKHFSNTSGETLRPVSNLKTMTLHHSPATDSKTKTTRLATVNMNPFDSISISKPEGSAASSKKIKRTYHIQPAKTSEARIIQTVDNQHYFKTTFFDHFERLALYDPGACCSTISRKFLEELQAFGYVPLQESSLKVEGAVGGATEEIKQIAYLDLKLETGYTIRDVPFLVLETGNDVLIGNNLIRAHRWANCWKNSNFYIDIGQDKKLVPTYDTLLPTDKPINTVAIKRITIYPSETTTVGLQIPHMGTKTLSKLKKQNLLTDVIEDNIDSSRFEVFPTMTRLRNSELQVVVKNKSNDPIQIHEGMEFAKVQLAPPDIQVKHIQELQKAKKIFKSIPHIHSIECHCKIHTRTNTNEVAIKILLSDRLGYTSIGLVTSKNKLETLKPGITFLPDNILTRSPLLLVVADEDGSLAHTDNIVTGKHRDRETS